MPVRAVLEILVAIAVMISGAVLLAAGREWLRKAFPRGRQVRRSVGRFRVADLQLPPPGYKVTIKPELREWLEKRKALMGSDHPQWPLPRLVRRQCMCEACGLTWIPTTIDEEVQGCPQCAETELRAETLVLRAEIDQLRAILQSPGSATDKSAAYRQREIERLKKSRDDLAIAHETLLRSFSGSSQPWIVRLCRDAGAHYQDLRREWVADGQ